MTATLVEKRKEIATYCIENNILLEPSLLGSITEETDTTEFLQKLAQEEEGEQAEQKKTVGSVKVVTSHDKKPEKIDVQHFVQYYNARFKALERILRGRNELQSITSIARLKHKADRERVSIIGMVREINVSKNKNYIITLEDQTGKISVMVTQAKKDMYNEVRNLVYDEVIGVTGSLGNNLIFADTIYWPDVPYSKELRKSPEEGYAIFASDIHVGSHEFLEENFDKLIEWLNGTVGSEQQQNMARKVKYFFIVGDAIDGIGIYPNQEKDLAIKDIYGQYEALAEFIKKIPSHINVIMCPGNHDAMRIAEPQPPIYKDLGPTLYEIPNLTLVSNPSMITIDASEGFHGIDILLYHGYSFDYFISNVDEIRNNGGYDRGDLVMRFLLKRRHLCPAHESTLHIPDPQQDVLVIDTIPDIFVTGHIHKSAVSNYRNVTLIQSSCFQDTTEFQVKVGHHPEPCRVPIVNLQTREVKILRF